MAFHTIDLSTWNRAEHFLHYKNEVQCAICITNQISITRLVPFLKQKKLRFYPVMIYLVTKALHLQTLFRLGTDQEGNVGYWDSIDPSYTIFHKETETFSCLWSSWNPDFHSFYPQICSDMESHQNFFHFSMPDIPPNHFDISCLPWLSYDSFHINVNPGTYLAPIITWGKYLEKEGEIQLPLSFQIHHSAADGFHVSQFYQDLDRLIAAFIEEYPL